MSTGYRIYHTGLRGPKNRICVFVCANLSSNELPREEDRMTERRRSSQAKGSHKHANQESYDNDLFPNLRASGCGLLATITLKSIVMHDVQLR
jgi:hypothetical protein